MTTKTENQKEVISFAETIKDKSDKELHCALREERKELAEIITAADNKVENPEAWIDFSKAAEQLDNGRTAGEIEERAYELRDRVKAMSDVLTARQQRESFEDALRRDVPLVTETPAASIVAGQPMNVDLSKRHWDAVASKESDEFQRAFNERQTYNVPGGVKEEFANATSRDIFAATMTTANMISVNRPRDDSGVVNYLDPMINISQRLPVVAPLSGGDSYSYIKESGAGGADSGNKKNNTVGPTAEGAKYNEQEMKTHNVVVTVKKLSAFTGVSDEQLEDVSAARQFIQMRLGENFNQKVESAVLNGSGSSNQWTGLLNQSNIQTVTKSGTIKKLDIFIDAYQKSVGVAYKMPDILAMPSATLVVFAKLKDADGNYIWSNVVSGMPNQIFGVPTVICEHLPANTGLMLSTSEFALLEKRGISVEWGMPGDNFLEGKQTVRASCRGNVIAWRENAAIKIASLNVADA